MGTFIDKMTGRMVSIDAVTEEKVMAITANGKVYFKTTDNFTPEDIAEGDGKTPGTAYYWCEENYRKVSNDGCCVLLYQPGGYRISWDCDGAKIEGESYCGDTVFPYKKNTVQMCYDQSDFCVTNMSLLITANIYKGCISDCVMYYGVFGDSSLVCNAILANTICVGTLRVDFTCTNTSGFHNCSFRNFGNVNVKIGVTHVYNSLFNIGHLNISDINNSTLQNIRLLYMTGNNSVVEDSGIYRMENIYGCTILRTHLNSDLKPGSNALNFANENLRDNLFRDCKFGKNDMNISIFKPLSTRNEFKGIIEFEQAILGDFIFEPLVLDDECTLKIIFRNSSPTDCTLTLPLSDTEIQHLCVENVVAIQAGVSIFVLTVKKLASDIYTYDIVGYRN